MLKRTKHVWPVLAAISAVLLLVQVVWRSGESRAGIFDKMSDKIGRSVTPTDLETAKNAVNALHNGREIFRYDTFGDEAFWGDTIGLHQAIQGSRFGGVGPGWGPRLPSTSA